MTRMLDDWPARAWTPEMFRRDYGRLFVRVRCYSAKSSHTFRHQSFHDYEDLPLADYLDFIELKRPVPAEYGVVSDWSLRESADLFAASPELLRDVRFSALFGRKQFSHFLWLGPAGYVTGLHADLVHVNLLAHLYGHKQVTLFAPDQTPCLYPESDEPVQDGLYSRVNAHAPDLAAHPLFAEAQAHVATIGPGELLFIPYGWWHMVRSLDVTVRVSGSAREV
ncbi:MAG: cupin-like domain-containing protein [Deltaproteobacteria bacterium]|nr:cupin-like domain-containing protein [Deltaproteobacteria bacterium]